jgi:hypothetical protein
MATDILFLTKEFKICIGEKICYFTDGAGKTGYPPTEDYK